MSATAEETDFLQRPRISLCTESMPAKVCLYLKIRAQSRPWPQTPQSSEAMLHHRIIMGYTEFKAYIDKQMEAAIKVFEHTAVVLMRFYIFAVLLAWHIGKCTPRLPMITIGCDPSFATASKHPRDISRCACLFCLQIKDLSLVEKRRLFADTQASLCGRDWWPWLLWWVWFASCGRDMSVGTTIAIEQRQPQSAGAQRQADQEDAGTRGIRVCVKMHRCSSPNGCMSHCMG